MDSITKTKVETQRKLRLNLDAKCLVGWKKCLGDIIQITAGFVAGYIFLWVK